MHMPVKPTKDTEALRADVKTLDSKVTLVAQKLDTIERNEEVLGRTLVAQNQRMLKLEEGGGKGAGEGAGGAELEQVKKDVEDLRKEIKEMRYVLDSINPLEYVTMDQLKDLLKEKK